MKTINCFKEGAELTNNQPKSPWISVKCDLPCNHSELISQEKSSKYLKATVYVVTVINGMNFLSRMYEFDGKWYWENDEPTHWFAIPDPPKE